MIDIHSHVLPRLDDGPRDFEQAVALLRSLADDGVTHLVATPHIYAGQFDNSYESIEDVFEAFKADLPPDVSHILVHWAAEVRLDEHVPRLLHSQALPFLSVGGSYRTVLLELPDSFIPVGTEKLIEHLLAHDVHPVIAHPERNKAIRERVSRATALVDMGCSMQLTAGALLGDFGLAVTRAAHQLVDASLIQAVASDAHNLNGRRPRMGAAFHYIQHRWGMDAAKMLTLTGPAKLCGLA